MIACGYQSGFKGWPGPDTPHGRVEILDHDTLTIHSKGEGDDDQISELKRIVEK